MCSPAAYYLASGDYARAMKFLPAARGEAVSSAAELNLRGVAEIVAGKPEDALSLFNQALAADPSMQTARFNRGIALLKLRRFSEAAAAFREVAEQPDGELRAAAAYHVGVALDQTGQYAAAEQWLDRALTIDPELDSALLYIGLVREKQQNFARAGEAYRDYMKRQPESLIAMVRFGVAAHRAGYLDTARKYLQQVVTLAPNSLEAAEARKFLVMFE